MPGSVNETVRGRLRLWGLIAAVLATPSAVSAQAFGVVTGITYAKMVEELDPWEGGASVGDTRTRRDFSLGMSYSRPVRPKVSLAAEPSLVTKGSARVGSDYDGVTMRYLEVPMLIRLGGTLNGRRVAPVVSAGLHGSVLLSCRWSPAGEAARMCHDERTAHPGETMLPPRLDAGATIGIGLELLSHALQYRIELRGNRGVRDLEQHITQVKRTHASAALNITIARLRTSTRPPNRN